MPGPRAVLVPLCGVVLLAGCGGGDETTGDAQQTATEAVPTEASVLDDPGAGEASPEAPAEGPGESELSDFDEQGVRAAFENYIRQINVGDAEAVCAAFAAGGLPLGELPVDRGTCAASLEASLGTKPKGGAPAWKRTEIVDVKAVSVGDGVARVTATVVHEFSDRNYTSVEEDVTYFREIAERWAVVQPSATLYRAMGYPEPPLRAFTPPATP